MAIYKPSNLLMESNRTDEFMKDGLEEAPDQIRVEDLKLRLGELKK